MYQNASRATFTSGGNRAGMLQGKPANAQDRGKSIER
jgi:hypothetical protein